MLDLHAIASGLMELERVAHEYVEEDPVQKVNTLMETATSQFNTWIEQTAAALESEKAALADMFQSTSILADQIDDLGRRLKGGSEDESRAETGEYDDALLTQHNDLVQRHNALIKAYKERESFYNARVRQFNEETERRRLEVDSVKTTATGVFEAYQRWISEEGLQRLWKELNAVHVALIQAVRVQSSSEQWRDLIHKVRRLRRLIGAHVIQQRDWVEGGLHVVHATLCQLEECHLTVDCGASVTAITPEMVDVLGLRDRLGEKVKIDLPNAIRIEAPQLVIPKITIGETEADFVKAVVLRESMPGVDGCLGLSFLDRFDYVIDNRGLSLKPMERTANKPQFNVFISHRSEVLPVARMIYDYLRESGYAPFLSEVSIGAYRTTDYQKAIDAALECAEHLIVVGSARSHFEAPWVEAEWRLFESCKRTGKKQGNIIPVLSGSIRADDLPFALGRYEVVSIDSPNWKKMLMEYLPHA